jgi:hypothetical protein
VRLYQVLALRSLGLPLDSIAVRLGAGVDPARPVRDHLAEVGAAVTELEVLRAKLQRLAEMLDAGDPPDTAALLEVEWPAWPASPPSRPPPGAPSPATWDLARQSTHTKEQEHA